ncbi:sulfatase [Luteitalea sp. TBR-22]|uniref:sulfatase family protein n=1 Tax=Luteitalea sp. TBR-22 TaxID=2802971 RepID=UPI001AF73DF4|nr:sulfatase [Luteitalea sp. TBR-22]BCS32901.1 sulfatase [Luteitalea sp. TBR-22]
MCTRRLLIQALVLVSLLATASIALAQEQPNILWLSSEDNGPQLGAYGDAYATTPALDRLAARGVRFTRAWAAAPVCAPSRTAIITGLSPQTTGGHNMRSEVPLPGDMPMFPALLRAAGYYTSNNVKEDYNHPTPAGTWDDSSKTAHWRGRRPGQPFFAVFNSVTTHESQIRRRPHTAVHDPAKVRVPPYHPDTPEVRQDWAQYYDKLTEMDREVEARLAELEADGLAESTIVVYWGDHGVGLPRGKRWLYPAGLDVPLIVHVPQRFRHLAPEGYSAGKALDRLVSLMDLGPSMLSAAGIRPPAWMQGQAFMGPFAASPRAWLQAGRDRMDERVDMSRAITDGRYLYIRNFRPDRRQGEYLAYMFETPTTQVWKARHDAGQLTPAQDSFWREKAPEELYDLRADPDAVRNLAGDPAHRAALERCRAALRRHLIASRDLGLLPEGDMHRRRGTRTAFDLGRDGTAFPVERVLEHAWMASMRDAGAAETLRRGLGDRDAAVRYWSATGLRLLGASAVAAHEAALLALLTDDVAPRVAAADALVRHGSPQARARAFESLSALLDYRAVGHHATMLALDTLVALGDLAAPIRLAAAAAPAPGKDVPAREQEYIARLALRLREQAAAVTPMR